MLATISRPTVRSLTFAHLKRAGPSSRESGNSCTCGFVGANCLATRRVAKKVCESQRPLQTGPREASPRQKRPDNRAAAGPKCAPWGKRVSRPQKRPRCRGRQTIDDAPSGMSASSCAARVRCAARRPARGPGKRSRVRSGSPLSGSNPAAREPPTKNGPVAEAVKQSMVPPAGFEPAVSTLKGWRPRPLDDGDVEREYSRARAPRLTTSRSRCRGQTGGPARRSRLARSPRRGSPACPSRSGRTRARRAWPPHSFPE